jgi:hypothetical protein
MGHFRSGDTGSAIRMAGPVLDSTTHIFDSTAESADRAESAALEIARRGGLRESTLEHVGLAVHEITLAIADQGKGFDLDSVSDPLSHHWIAEGSGRGIFLARKFMDELSVQRDRAGWHRVTMVKYL